MKAQVKLYTAKEMAKILKVSPGTVRRYGQMHLIGVYQPMGKSCMVRYYLKEGMLN